MRVHDWSRVDDGTFHHFHHSWIEEIQRALNGGLLPEWLYAFAIQPGRLDLQNAEQQVSEFGPDVLAFQAPGSKDEMKSSERDGNSHSGSDTGLMVAPPRVAITLQGAEDFYTQPQKSVTIRHATDDRIIAIVEIAESALCIEAILKHFAEVLPRICNAGR